MRFFKPIFLALLLALPLSAFASSPLSLEGESYRINKETGTLTYDNPTAHFEDMSIMGKSLVYNKNTKQAKFTGNIVVKGAGYIINAESAIYDGSRKNMTLYKVQFFDAVSLAYIEAKQMTRLAPGYFKLDSAKVTLCKPGEQDWYFENSSVYYYIDDYAQSYNTALFFKGVPVFYSPYFAWPTKKGRASGYLAPDFLTQRGHVDESKNWGTKISVPYFFALDQDHDLTLTFDFISQRGLGVGFDYNYAFSEGLAGRFNFWGINESEDRDPDKENFGGLDTSAGDLEEFNPNPLRYRFNFDHRQSVPFGGQMFISSYQISDNEIFKEYDNRKTTIETHQQNSLGFSFPWAGGGLSANWNQTDQFNYQSVYDTSNNAKTYLNSQPAVSVSHLFSSILGTNVSLSTGVGTTAYKRIEGWSGEWNYATATLSYPFHIDFLNIQPSYSQTLYQVTPTYAYASGTSTVAGFNANPEATSFAVETKRLELNFELFKLFYHPSGKADARLSFVPKVIYEEVSDVDQRAIVNTSPSAFGLTGDDADFSQTGYSTDYSTYGAMFQTPIYSRRTLSYVLSGTLLNKNLLSKAVQGTFNFDLTQPYNLNRKETLTEQNQSFVGPQLGESVQETTLGNQKMPLRANFSFAPNAFFSTSVFYRYGHEEKQLLENRFAVSTKSEAGSTVSLGYQNNRKAYTELDGVTSHLASQNYSLTQHLYLSEKLTLDAAGVWDLSRSSLTHIAGSDSENRLDRTLTSLNLGLTYQVGCYAYYAGYSESILSYEGVEGVEQRLTLSINLAGWPGSNNPYKTTFIGGGL